MIKNVILGKQKLSDLGAPWNLIFSPWGRTLETEQTVSKKLFIIITVYRIVLRKLLKKRWLC
jgi:hypothetical protein